VGIKKAAVGGLGVSNSGVLLTVQRSPELSQCDRVAVMPINPAVSDGQLGATLAFRGERGVDAAGLGFHG
jgi:hypothetical protein